MDGKKSATKPRIECTQDGDEWVARDLDTDECAYGSTQTEALIELIAQLKQARNQSQAREPAETDDALPQQAQLRDNISQMFRTAQAATAELKKLQKKLAAVGPGARAVNTALRRHFTQIFRIKALHDALVFSDTKDAAIMNLLLINVLVGTATGSVFTIPGLMVATQAIASEEQTLINGIKNYLDGFKAVPDSSANELHVQNRKSLEATMATHQEQLRFAQQILNSPLGIAGKLATRGAAANNPEGAARGALIRALNQCIPAGYSSEHGYNRFALIKQLLAIARIDASPALIRRLIHG